MRRTGRFDVYIEQQQDCDDEQHSDEQGVGDVPADALPDSLAGGKGADGEQNGKVGRVCSKSIISLPPAALDGLHAQPGRRHNADGDWNNCNGQWKQQPLGLIPYRKDARGGGNKQQRHDAQ